MIMFENPRRRRRSRSGRFVKSRRSRRCSPKRRRRRSRRNPTSLATYGLRAAALGNPRRRRRSKRRRGSRRVFGVQTYLRQLQNRIPDVGWGLEGFFVTAAAPQYIGRFFPMVSKEGNQFVYYAAKTAAALANARLVEQFMNRRAGDAAALGGLLTIGAEVVKDWIFPMVGLSAYLDGMGAYLDAGDLGETPGSGYTIPPELSYGGARAMPSWHRRQEVMG